MKVMTVIDISPGRVNHPKDGRPIGILLVEYKGEVEQPAMFVLDDVRRMALGFMRVLAHHGSEDAEQALLQYFPDALFEEERPALPTPIAKASKSHMANRPTLVAQFRMRRANPISFSVLAGYRVVDQWMLLVQSQDFGSIRLLVKVGRRMSVFLKGHSDYEALPERDWESLRIAQAGSKVSIGKRSFSVMSDGDIRSLVDDKKFWVTAPK